MDLQEGNTEERGVNFNNLITLKDDNKGLDINFSNLITPNNL